MGEGNGQRPARKNPAGRSCQAVVLELAVIAAAAVFAGVVLALAIAGATGHG